MLVASLLVTSRDTLHAADSPPASNPNIIFVMPDDVGYGDYTSLGAPIVRTPAVDGFMKQSQLFSKFHLSPTCSPSRAALFSGRHEFKNGVTHTIFERERMSLKTITQPQVLKTAGYTTDISENGTSATRRPIVRKTVDSMKSSSTAAAASARPTRDLVATFLETRTSTRRYGTTAIS